MTREEFYKEYRRLHFKRFRFFPDHPEIEFEWSIYIDERDGSLHAMTTPPPEYYGKTWWRLSYEEREEELENFDPDFKFDEEEFGRLYLDNFERHVGRWKTLSEYDARIPPQGFSIN